MWRMLLAFVPSWVPFIGKDSEGSAEHAISGFNLMRASLKASIKKANTEKSVSSAKIRELNEKIREHESKSKKADKTIRRASRVMSNIDKFIGEVDTLDSSDAA